MNKFINISDIHSFKNTLTYIANIKRNPFKDTSLGKNKTLAMLFFNPSLRTRFSTQKAAENLGMKTITVNLQKDSWNIEFEDHVVMNGSTSEHIKEAAKVISEYCDILAIRAFASLTDKQKDEQEWVLQSFQKYASVPIISMESALAHPLQALTDAFTIFENNPQQQKINVVLSWAPHPKALPHAVANSFVETMQLMDDINLVITNPPGYNLNPYITKTTPVLHNQNEALKNADIVYVKNWSSYQEYGKVISENPNWMVTRKKMEQTNNAKLMHCLPVRRNVVISDDALNHPNSIIIKQAENRVYAAQYIIKSILEHV